MRKDRSASVSLGSSSLRLHHLLASSDSSTSFRRRPTGLLLGSRSEHCRELLTFGLQCAAGPLHSSLFDSGWPLEAYLGNFPICVYLVFYLFLYLTLTDSWMPGASILASTLGATCMNCLRSFPSDLLALCVSLKQCVRDLLGWSFFCNLNTAYKKPFYLLLLTCLRLFFLNYSQNLCL